MLVTRRIPHRPSRTTCLLHRTYRLRSEPLETLSPILLVWLAHAAHLFRKNVSDFLHFIPHPLRVLQDKRPYRSLLSLLWQLRLNPMTPEQFFRGCEPMTVPRSIPSLHQKNRLGTSGARLCHQMLSKLTPQDFTRYH
jgi:hypothetical protein